MASLVRSAGLRVKTFLLRHATLWISKTDPKAPTTFGIEFELDWPDAQRPDPHLPAPPENFEAANTAASSSNKK